MYMYTVPMVSVKKYNKNISEHLGMVRENVFKKCMNIILHVYISESCDTAELCPSPSRAVVASIQLESVSKIIFYHHAEPVSS